MDRFRLKSPAGSAILSVMRTYWNWRVDSASKLLLYLAVLGHAIAYLAELFPILGAFLYACMLSPTAVLRGQVWRLVTWVIIPYDGGYDNFFGLLFLMFFLYLRYWFSCLAEDVLGTRYFIIYYAIGIVFTDIAAFLALPLGWMPVPAIFNLYYLNITIFLIVAVTYPYRRANFMFVLPMNMITLALIDIGFIVYDVAKFLRMGLPQILLVVVPALLTFASLLLFPDVRKPQKVVKTKRQREFQKKMTRMTPPNAGIHKCRICGRTDVTNPELEFRYCSKCMGNYEYCSEHLFTHQHVKT